MDTITTKVKSHHAGVELHVERFDSPRDDKINATGAEREMQLDRHTVDNKISSLESKQPKRATDAPSDIDADTSHTLYFASDIAEQCDQNAVLQEARTRRLTDVSDRQPVSAYSRRNDNPVTHGSSTLSSNSSTNPVYAMNTAGFENNRRQICESDRYSSVPVFNEDSPLDRTGRFAPKTEPLLTEYSSRASAAAEEMQNEMRKKKRYLKSINQLNEEARIDFVKSPPFEPRVPANQSCVRHPEAGQNVDPRVIGGGSFLPVSRTRRPKQAALIDRIEKIREQHEKSLKKRESDKQLLCRAELKMCTFKPEISKGSQEIITHQRRASDNRSRSRSRDKFTVSPGSDLPDSRVFADVPPPPPGSGAAAAAERLFREAWTRKADAMERSRRMKENNGKIPFQPSINPASEFILHKSESDYRPVFERLGDIQRSRNAYRERSIKLQVCLLYIIVVVGINSSFSP